MSDSKLVKVTGHTPDDAALRVAIDKAGHEVGYEAE